MQYVVATEEGRLAGAVLTDEQGNRPQAAPLLSLEAAHVLQGQLARMVQRGMSP